jgi:NADPH-dependent ferric siderophore reductase
MNATSKDIVEDPNDRLEQDDHMRGMEHTEMTVEKVERPFPSVARVTARIAPTDPAPWRLPNLAIRIEVEAPEGQRPISRIYTIRSFDEARGVVEVDFVMHEDESPAMRWLGQAGKGTVVTLTGPRPHYLPAWEAGRKVAVFADETAIPAVYSLLQNWQAGVEGAVHIETADRAAFEELPQVAGVTLHLWLRAPNEAPGTTGRLVAAAKALPEPDRWTIWAADERQEARAIRRHFTEACGLPKENVRAAGYWRRGVSSSEVDRLRLRHYEDVISRGGGLRDFEDLDVQI